MNLIIENNSVSPFSSVKFDRRTKGFPRGAPGVFSEAFYRHRGGRWSRAGTKRRD
jgi:hypothetical protein